MKIKHPFKIILLVLLLLLFKTNVGNAEVRYNPNDLRVKSNASVNDIYNMLEGCKYQYSDVAAAIKEAEEKYNINAVFIVSLTKFESGNGSNKLTKEHYNITSMKNIQGGWKHFESYQHCIDYTCRCLNRSYLNPNGCYFKGYGIQDVNTYYCTENWWGNSINNISYNILDKLN